MSISTRWISGVLAGRIEGEQAACGVAIAFEDLLIGAAALHLGYGVATWNVGD
ncbi:MAG TPA: hypothetical protein VJN89_09650 [Candidatus Acidoferrum sp.]|nr:hypothetical protein [Candidatus Acidoferrum sp.]